MEKILFLQLSKNKKLILNILRLFYFLYKLNITVFSQSFSLFIKLLFLKTEFRFAIQFISVNLSIIKIKSITLQLFSTV